MKLKGFLAVLILAAAVVFFIFYLRSKPGGDLPRQVESFSAAKAKTTRINMQAIEREVISFTATYGRTPRDLQEMINSRLLFSDVNDAWGTPIRYRRLPGDSFQLVSAGADREFDTEDDILLPR